jgi:hypothetical protein
MIEFVHDVHLSLLTRSQHPPNPPEFNPCGAVYYQVDPLDEMPAQGGRGHHSFTS